MATIQRHGNAIYSLTSLQIGDMQSYVSKLYLHVGRKNLIFFVDNVPWSSEGSLRSKPVELWQLMVTQSRMSPFANRSIRCPIIARIQRENDQDIHTNDDDVSSVEKWSLKRKLFNKDRNHMVKFFRDLFQTRLRSVVHMQELSHLLYGCVTFVLEWKNIRGINYVNELQTDTYVALELKLLVKRDFHDMKEASIFYGLDQPDPEAPLMSNSSAAPLQAEKLLQKQSLESSIFGVDEDLPSGMSSYDEYFSDQSLSPREPSYLHDASDSDIDAVCYVDKAAPFGTCCTPDMELKSSLLMEDCRNQQFLDAVQSSCKVEDPLKMGMTINPHNEWPCLHIEEKDSLVKPRSTTADSHDSSDISDDISVPSSFQDDDEEEELLVYSDTLLIFRFCDPLLPFKLKEIITADQRLLKMLESGLPSWVIFLQSYPVFRRLYRPWMRPLAKTLYILVSIVTVIIGFYDLYKNVPVLKATAARICGPFFEWIEAWEMVSRIKYLGTVLFLQNWEKAFRWLLLVFSTIRKLSNLIFQPMSGPLEDLIEFIWPVWNVILDSVWGFTSLLWMICLSVLEYTNFILQLLALPLIWSITAISSLVTWILYPVIYAIWGFFILPIRLIMLLVDFIVAVFCSIYKALQNFWFLVNSSSQILSAAGSQTGTAANSSASALRLLWNDIFSQVFRAVRSILNVVVAFFTTCNRHRLSIYNHTEAFISNVRGLVKSTPWKISTRHLQAVDSRELEDERHKRSSKALTVAAPRKSRKRICSAER